MPIPPTQPLTYECRPDDDSLREFVSPRTNAPIGNMSLNVKDDGNVLELKQRFFPALFKAFVFGGPACYVGGTAYFWFSQNEVSWSSIIIAGFMPIQMALITQKMRQVNALHRANAVRARLNRRAATLELPEYGVTLPKGSTDRLVLVSGLQFYGPTLNDKWTAMPTHELSVIGEVDGQWKRWPIINWRRCNADYLADEISAVLNVPVVRCEVDDPIDVTSKKTNSQ